MLSTVYHKKAFFIKIPPHPPFPVYERHGITKGGMLVDALFQRVIVSVPQQNWGFIPPKAGLAPQRGLTAIGKESNPPLSPFVKRGKSYTSLWQREVGRDFPREMHIPENVKHCEPPAKPGVYLRAN